MSSTNSGVIDEILASVGRWIADAIERVGTFLADLFRPIISSIEGFIGTVFDRIKAVATRIGEEIEGLVDSVLGRLQGLFTKLDTFITDLWNAIVGKLEAVVSDALEFISSVFDRVAENISALFTEVTGWLSDIANRVLDTISGIGDTIKGWIIDAYDFLTSKIAEIVHTVTIWIQNLFDDVKLAITDIIERAAQVVDAIVQGVRDFIESVVDVVGAALRDLLEAASKIPDALVNLGEGMAASVEEYIGKPLSEIPAKLWEQLADVMQSSWGVTEEIADAFRRPIMGRTQTAPQNRAEWDEFFSETIPKGGTAGVLFNTFIGLFLLMRIGGGIADANAQIVLQEFGEEFPYNIPQVADVIRLKHFNIIDENQAIPLIRKQGYSDDDARRLIQIGETIPPEGEALSWWLRGIYTDEDIELSLSKQGWNEYDRSALKRAAQIIPPVQDLITMAVREVFTPEVAERFGQFEDFPDAFKEWAAKVGLSEEWARNYWGAHWALPSPQMGFEMLHRREIDVDDLNLLLKSADVMPFWRDKIVAISYAPFTRVDIRRMHKVGVLNDDEVYEAYQDIGYDKDKAQKLTDFTLELNRDKSVDDDVELVELSRSNIIGFYEDGLLERGEAFSMLRDIGLSSDAASLYLTSVDLSDQRRERKDETALILDQAKAGLVSFERAQDLLSGLGLETRELSRALTKLIRQQAQRTKLPSKGDLDKMLANQIIETAEYKQTLLLLGYSELWADRYVQLAAG